MNISIILKFNMKLKKSIIFFFLIFVFPTNSYTIGTETGLKIPRFVSLKTDEANLRLGSSKNYPIKLKYIIKNIPLEIIDEYDVWRKVVDFEKNEGWIHKSLIKSERFAVINLPYEEKVQIFNKPKGKVIGKIGKRNIVKIKKCLKKWCLIEKNKNKGWVLKINLWGVYDNEKINVPFYQYLINKYWELI